MVARTGLEMGRTIWVKIVIWLAPSILADSMMESGMVERKKVREMVTFQLDTARGRIRTHMVSFRCRTWEVTT